MKIKEKHYVIKCEGECNKKCEVNELYKYNIDATELCKMCPISDLINQDNHSIYKNQ